MKKFVSIISGVVVGAINGFFGGGGGMIVVPLLERVLKKPTKTAHATAILIILPVSLFSAVTYLLKGSFNPMIGGVAGAGVVIGGLLGALLLSKLSNNIIRIVFNILMLVAGIKLIIG